MKPFHMLLLLPFLLTATACHQGNIALEQQTPQLQAQSTQAANLKATKNVLRTVPLTPKPIRVSLADLPKPFATQSADKPAEVVPIPQNPTLSVPPGFVVNVFADGLDKPRWLGLTPTGDVLVTETPENWILLLRDNTGDGVANVRHTFAGPENGLEQPFGMAFANSSFLVGNTNAVVKFPYTQGQQQITGTGEKIANLPGGGYNQHWTRNLIVSPEQKLYVSVGSKGNDDQEPLPRASVQVMNLNGSNQHTFAFGLRNPVGLAFQPQTGQLYTTVNERDGLGDNLVPDYLTSLQPGEFYGWPYAYLAPQNLDPRLTQANGKSLRPDLVARTRTPDVLFQAHSAALGLQFYTGKTFPAKYRNGAFVAMRGSWNRDRGTGYKIVFVPFDAQGRPQGYYEDFLTGFLLNPQVPTTWGRPVGLLVAPDGSLLFTDEANNRIYRIQYHG